MALSPAAIAESSGTPKKANAKTPLKKENDEKAGGVGSDEDENLQFMTPGSGSDPKAKLGITEEGAVTSPMSDDHKTANEKVDDEATPTKVTPKKRTPKNKVKLENDGGDGASPETPKKRGYAAKPKDGGKPAPKRAKKADDKKVSGRQSFSNAIAASKALQNAVLSGGEDAGEADQAIDNNSSQEIAKGSLEVLAHQDGMFPDLEAVDNELFNRYSIKEEES